MESIYKTILEDTLAGFWDWNILTQEQYLSPSFKAMFGYNGHDLPNTPESWRNLIFHSDKPLVDISLKRHFESHGEEPYDIEIRYVHKDGSIKWIKSIGRVIEWDKGRPTRMVGCHIDITEKKLAELELKISEESFRGAFEYSAIGMAIVSPEGNWLKVNKKLCELLGYTREELLKKRFQDLTHPDDLKGDKTLLDKLLTKETEDYRREKRYFTKAGDIIWVLVSVSLVLDHDKTPLYLVTQIKDITERKIAEKALRESEMRWHFALEGFGSGLWDWDLQNNTIFYSTQCLSMIGLPEKGLGTIPGAWTERVHPDDREQYLADMQLYLDGKTSIYSNQHRVLCSDNKYLWILDRGRVIEWSEDHKPLRIIGTHTDITGQIEKEAQLKKTFDIISEQNSRLLNFAYIVSHNLRTHSGNFKMIMDLIHDPILEQDEKQELISHLKKISEQLSGTIEHLNEVVSIQSQTNIQRSQINLHSYIEKTAEILSGDITKYKVTVKNEVPVDYELNYNLSYLESILLNFFTNAIKYRSLKRQPEIIIKYFKENDKCGITIADNGIGIDLEKNGHQLFGMYKTFNGNSDAKGVGLFITKNQVESMGGKVEVESEIDKGTTFKVYFNC